MKGGIWVIKRDNNTKQERVEPCSLELLSGPHYNSKRFTSLPYRKEVKYFDNKMMLLHIKPNQSVMCKQSRPRLIGNRDPIQ